MMVCSPLLELHYLLQYRTAEWELKEHAASNSSPSEMVTEQLHRYPSSNHQPPARYSDLYQ